MVNGQRGVVNQIRHSTRRAAVLPMTQRGNIDTSLPRAGCLATLAGVTNDPRRSLPSVDSIVSALDGTAAAHPHAALVAAARVALDGFRSELGPGSVAPTLDLIIEAARSALEHGTRASLRRVINATGVILQTNLGRAPLSDRAMAAIADAAADYTNLEFDLASGERGSRHDHVRELIGAATGAEDGMVVNNNAAALYMALHVFAGGREVAVSRGHAVEIGGGFRIPDVARESGARLVEVGTTNRTYARDYAAAWGPETAAILRVHASNFRIVGFTEEAAPAELATVAHSSGGLLIDDLGSGCLVATERYGMAHEPTVQESLAAGTDLVLFSGDKLLGGPQCGIIAGRTELVARLRAHPLARALRVDKLTIAALCATLLSYVEGRAAEELPVWQMIALDPASIRRRAQRWARAAGPAGSVAPSRSMVGGGSLPGEGVATFCAAIRPDAGAERLTRALRAAEPPVVGRVHDGAVLLDPRTVRPIDDRRVSNVLRDVMAGL